MEDQNFMITIPDQLESTWSPQITCLIAQLIVTVVVIFNLRKNWEMFPIKQLSPLCTSVAAMSFLFLNVLSVSARIIESERSLYHFNLSPSPSNQCGQCRIYEDNLLVAMTIFYLALRELPLVLFALKTIRVSVCFIDYKSNELPQFLVTLFRKERTIVLTSMAYSLVIAAANFIQLLAGGLEVDSATLTFQFFCPKQSGIIDWIATMLRYLLLAVSYTLSIRTYRELDFKRFIFLVFLLSNTQVVMRCIFVFLRIDSTTYHQFYYHSLFLNLLGTIVLYPYSNFNRYVQQPPGAAVLESFDAFLNYAPGISILQYFAHHRDNSEHTSRYHHTFSHFLEVRQMKMLATLNPKCVGRVTPLILQILKDYETAGEIPEALELREKANQGELTLGSIKLVQKRLFEFCQRCLFKEWKKTESRVYLQKEFKKNLVINQKMSSLGIDI